MRKVFGASAKFWVRYGTLGYMGTGYLVHGYGVSRTWVRVSNKGFVLRLPTVNFFNVEISKLFLPQVYDM